MSALANIVAVLQEHGCDPHPGQRGRYRAICPAHADSSPSLSVAEGDNEQVIIHCFAGCATEDVLKDLDLKWSDLYPEGEPTGSTEPRRRVARRAKRLVKPPEDRTYGIVPAHVILEGCQECLWLISYLGLRCGKDNTPVRGFRRIEAETGRRRQTLVPHAEYLAMCGWINYKAETNANGARRNVAAQLWLRHFPPFKIVNPGATALERHHLPKREPKHLRGAQAAPHKDSQPHARRTTPRSAKRTTLEWTVACQAHHCLGTRYEDVGNSRDAREMKVSTREVGDEQVGEMARNAEAENGEVAVAKLVNAFGEVMVVKGGEWLRPDDLLGGEFVVRAQAGV